VKEGQDLGSPVFLRRYERERHAANLGMLGGLTALHKLYGAKEGPWRWVRNVGLGALNGAGPLKDKIAAVAMGGGGGGEGGGGGVRQQMGGSEKKGGSAVVGGAAAASAAAVST
jgi:hypothetical protein